MNSMMTRFVPIVLTMLAAGFWNACKSDSHAGEMPVTPNGGRAGAATSSSPTSSAALNTAGRSSPDLVGSAGRTASTVTPPINSKPAASSAGTSASAGANASAAGSGDAPAAGASGQLGSPDVAAAGAGAGGAGSTAANGCDPKDVTPPAKVIQYNGKDSPLWENGAMWYEPDAVTDVDTPNTGPYQFTIEVDPTADTFTVYRPMLKQRLLPIVAWANGGCFQDGTFTGEFLKEIASYGFLIIADGPPGGSDTSPSDGTRQKAMIDWALKENERPCSTYYHTLDTQKIAVSGNSCGGLMTFYAAPDPRVTTAVLFNSGLFDRDQMLYDSLHTPIAIFDGGPDDPAYENAQADIAAIDKVPVFFANDKRGHAAYLWDDNGGEAAKVGVAWFNWQLLGDTGDTGKGMFVGADCGMCKNTKVWTDTAWKNEQLLKN